MPGPAWGEDSSADETLIAANVATLLAALLVGAPARVAATNALAHQWHRAIFAGVGSVPAESYLGSPRGSPNADLADYEVELADPFTGRVLAEGVPASMVAGELDRFEGALMTATRSLDPVMPIGQPPATADELLAVVELAAVAHGEWVRIHPYANGNGRTARTWANWIALRYGLPPFARIKPRPDGLLYGQAARASMGLPPDFRVDHSLTVSVFLDLLRQRPA